MFPTRERSINQRIVVNHHSVELSIKREDLIDYDISGNKFRKLKYNLREAKKEGYHTLLTFGGAFSNHIAAVALMGKIYDFKTIGIIRGEELENQRHRNTTLTKAKSLGMHLKFVSRTDYREKNAPVFLQALRQEFGDFYLIPEGGTNALAVKGCEEILGDKDRDFDYICCPVGTGGTLCGLINTSLNEQQVLGFCALKGAFVPKEIHKFAKKDNWCLISDYHFGGFGKVSSELITFINKFKRKTGIPLDPVYTGKTMFGVFDMISKNQFKNNSKVLCIHTGGLQGIHGMNKRLKQKNMPLIELWKP